MLESETITEIYDGDLIRIWRESPEEYFYISFFGTNILVPDVDTLYSILQDFKMCIADLNGSFDINRLEE